MNIKISTLLILLLRREGPIHEAVCQSVNGYIYIIVCMKFDIYDFRRHPRALKSTARCCKSHLTGRCAEEKVLEAPIVLPAPLEWGLCVRHGMREENILVNTTKTQKHEPD